MSTGPVLEWFAGTPSNRRRHRPVGTVDFVTGPIAPRSALSKTAMTDTNNHRAATDTATAKEEKRRELWLFLVVTLIVFPVLAVCIVGGYGFAVWIFQMIAGPPGPPGS